MGLIAARSAVLRLLLLLLLIFVLGSGPGGIREIHHAILVIIVIAFTTLVSGVGDAPTILLALCQ